MSLHLKKNCNECSSYFVILQEDNEEIDDSAVLCKQCILTTWEYHWIEKCSLVPRPSHNKQREGLGDGPIRACSREICGM